MRMQAAEVLIAAGGPEGKRVAIVGVERRRLECLGGRGDGVRNVVAVRPRHLGTGLDGERLWREGEIIDRHLGVGRARLTAYDQQCGRDQRGTAGPGAARATHCRCDYHELRLDQLCSGISMIARRCWPCLNFTSVMPSSLRN